MSYAPIPMVPGPVALHEDVIAVLGRDYGSGQVESDFLCLYDATSRGIGKLMGTKDDVVLMTGEGMLALWGALKSCLKPGDHVVSVGTGVFGDGIGEMAESFGCIVEKVSLPYDCSIRESDLAAVEEAIRRVKPVMLTAVHCETPSGTLNPIGLLGKLKKDLGVPLFYVDTVAGLGGAPVHMDEWNVDLMLGGSQKCLSCPPSMSMVGVSAAAWERMKEVNYQGYDAILPVIMRLPDVVATEAEAISEEEHAALLAAVEAAAAHLDAFREQEGAILIADLLRRVELIEQYKTEVVPFEKARTETVKARILDNLSKLAVDVDRNRLEQEMIFYLEKLDITEEKVRLTNHCNYFREVASSEEGAGRKLGFIAQEMGREINTMGSKANEPNIQILVVKMKDELEKIKEQVLNIL